MELLGILLDMDGTLIYSLPDIVEVVNSVRHECQLPTLAFSEIQKHVGRGADNMIDKCFGDPMKFGWEKERLVKRVREAYVTLKKFQGHVYPTVSETLSKLRAVPFIRLAVVTNRSTKSAENTLSHYLPQIQFDAIYGADKVREKKPSAMHCLEVMHFLNLSPRESWLIGDDTVDLQSAEAADIHFLAVRYGLGDVQAAPEKHIDRFDQILHKIPRLRDL